MELHWSLGVARNMTGRRERAAMNLFLISVQSESGEGRQTGEMLCPIHSPLASSPPSQPGKGSTTGFIPFHPLIPQSTCTRAPSPRACSSLSLDGDFALNALRWAQAWQVLELTQAGNSYYKLVAVCIIQIVSYLSSFISPQVGKKIAL